MEAVAPGKLTHAARCPGCGSPASAYLWSSDQVPIYRCGSFGDTIHCRPEPHEIVNVVTPTDAELAEYAQLVEVAAMAWVRDPRIGICTLAGCDRVAIDGLCLTHR